MSNDLNPQLQQILDNLGYDLQNYINEEVARQLGEQKAAAVNIETPPERQAEWQQPEQPEQQQSPQPEQQPEIEQFQPEQYQADITNYQSLDGANGINNIPGGMSDYDKMFGILARLKNKHAS